MLLPPGLFASLDAAAALFTLFTERATACLCCSNDWWVADDAVEAWLE
jgi:hypothetical protein